MRFLHLAFENKCVSPSAQGRSLLQTILQCARDLLLRRRNTSARIIFRRSTETYYLPGVYTRHVEVNIKALWCNTLCRTVWPLIAATRLNCRNRALLSLTFRQCCVHHENSREVPAESKWKGHRWPLGKLRREYHSGFNELESHCKQITIVTAKNINRSRRLSLTRLCCMFVKPLQHKNVRLNRHLHNSAILVAKVTTFY